MVSGVEISDYIQQPGFIITSTLLNTITRLVHPPTKPSSFNPQFVLFFFGCFLCMIPELLNLSTIDILYQIFIVGRLYYICDCYYGMFRNIPGLYPLEASNIQVRTTKNVKYLLGDTATPIQEPLCYLQSSNLVLLNLLVVEDHFFPQPLQLLWKNTIKMSYWKN